VALPVLLDPVGEVSKAPRLDSNNLAAAILDNAGEGLDELVNLRTGDILARNKYVFLEWH
jgi:hypothetical protein